MPKCDFTLCSPVNLLHIFGIPFLKNTFGELFLEDATNESNYRPISILPLLSIIFGKVMHEQVYKYLYNYLNDLMCRFWKAHSIELAFFRLIQSWKKKLDNSDLVGTILMDLSRAYVYLPHDHLIAKLEVYGFDKSSLNLANDYLSFRKQRTKVCSS